MMDLELETGIQWLPTILTMTLPLTEARQPKLGFPKVGMACLSVVPQRRAEGCQLADSWLASLGEGRFRLSYCS